MSTDLTSLFASLFCPRHRSRTHGDPVVAVVLAGATLTLLACSPAPPRCEAPLVMTSMGCAVPCEVLDACGNGCPERGQVRCGNVCAHLSSDVMHCGACGHFCVAPAHGRAICESSICQLECDDGYGYGSQACSPRARLVAPLSGSRVTSSRPTLRWRRAAGLTRTHVELCRDRLCTMIVHRLDSDGTSASPPADLAPGVYFWRAAGDDDAGRAWSHVWEFAVGTRTTTVDSTIGVIMDGDGDGRADLAAAVPSGASATVVHGMTHLYSGASVAMSGAPILSVPGFGGLVGDVDGDGLADLLVREWDPAPRAYFGRTYSGSADGPPRGGFLGGEIAATGGVAVGDVDGDGYGDIASPGRTASQAARLAIYRGSAFGLRAAPAELIAADAFPLEEIISVVAGDFNGDRLPDLYAIRSDASGRRSPMLWVNGAGGLRPATPPSVTLRDGRELALGESAGVGDLNGDGFADVHVIAFIGGSDQAVPWILAHFGGLAGLDPRPSAEVRVMTELHSNATTATSLDVDRDGFDDVAVGFPNVGAVQLYFGGVRGPASGRIARVQLVDPAPGNPGLFGAAVAGIGDIDRDGFADFAVGQPHVMDQTGAVHLYRGGAMGPITPAAVVLAGRDGARTNFGRWITPR